VAVVDTLDYTGNASFISYFTLLSAQEWEIETWLA
jgi:hypothetical protein